MQSISSNFVHKVSKIDLNVAAQKKKNSHLCQGKCFDTRCGEPPAISNGNTRYNRNIGLQKIFY